jgi:cytochrome o ubiquinol oxidase subunit I
VAQLAVSIRERDRRRDLTGDPWYGRTLEWSIPSPPPAWNFAVLPQIKGNDAYWASKQGGQELGRPDADRSYVPVQVPRNNPTGFFLAFCAVVLGFALIWHIWWMAAAGLLGSIAVCLVQAWRTDGEIEIPAEEVAAFYRKQAAKEIAI